MMTSPSIYQRLKPIFNPRGVAVIGASNNPEKFGSMFLNALLDTKFPRVYPVNPNEAEVSGLISFKRVEDIPGPVDYSLISVPISRIIEVIKDCGRKSVKGAAIFTAGFSEGGTEKGKNLEKEMVNIAKEYGLRLIGPNCIGIYCPSSRLAFFPGLSQEEGCIGFISQSGGHAEELARQASKWGLTFSKIISYGNGCDLDSADFLEYLGEDPDTKIVTLYVEGVKDGPRFVKALRRVTASKPVVVWKGGTSDNSARAAASHTGSMAGSNEVWNTVLNYPGVIRVQDFEELGDTLLTIQYLCPPKSKNVAVIGAGGGFSVAVTDVLERFGLVVKRFTSETIGKLNEIIPALGTGTKNPIDLSYFLMQDISLLKKSFEIVANDPNIDILLTHISPDFTGNDALSDAFISRKQVEIVEVLVDIKNLMGECFPEKPFAVILNAPAKIEYEIDRLKINETLLKKGIPVYLSSTRAAKALQALTQLALRRAMEGYPFHSYIPL